MLDLFRRASVCFFGDGEATLSVPIFDGALKPNNLLEDAAVFAERSGLEDLAIDSDGVLFAACGREVVRFDASGGATTVACFDAPLQALALCADGGLAVAVDGRIIFEGGAAHGKQLSSVDGRPLHGVNAIQSAPDGKLLISDGSERRAYAEWSHDLLEHGRSGRVLEHDPANGTTRVLAANLQYCYGVCSDGTQVLAAESWAHQVVALNSTSRASVIDALPGYPARISRAAGGGFWLSLFAGRTQLLEFVLRENDFRKEMMHTIAPQYWVAPALQSDNDFLEPLQCGGVKQMGILKPWAPPRSYGLLIRLGADLRPRYSLHSRAGGRHHGIVCAAEYDTNLYVLSKGAGRILRLPLAQLEADLNVGKVAS